MSLPRHLFSRLILFVALTLPGYLLFTNTMRWASTGVFATLGHYQPIPVALLGLFALIGGLMTLTPWPKSRLGGYFIGAVFFGMVAMTITFSLLAGVPLVSPLGFAVPAVILAFGNAIKICIDEEEDARALEEVRKLNSKDI